MHYALKSHGPSKSKLGKPGSILKEGPVIRLLNTLKICYIEKQRLVSGFPEWRRNK